MAGRTVVAAMLIALLTAVSAFGAVKEASWHDQLMEMGYHILHLSSINVINGLNLSRVQARELRGMTREVEKAGGYIPRMRRPLPGELAEMRRTYVELAKVLMQGKEVPEEMGKRVLKARTIEARVIRDSISERPTSKDRGTCLRCHLSTKRVAELRRPRGGAGDDPLSGRGLYKTPGAKREVALAHIEGILGQKGMHKVSGLAGRVDDMLTDAQKEILGEFACCLVPPKDLSDPVRVGQAAATDRKMNLLRLVRRIPDHRWEQARQRLITRLLEMQTVKETGTTERQLAAYRRQLARTLDEVRRMSDTEFEMKKEALCAQLGTPNASPPENERQRIFKQAYFLLMPGSVKAYDALLKRMK